MKPPSTKRSNYLEWEEYFMAIAFLSAQRSKDPRTQVGACIVNQDKKIVGIGYNGMPIGCNDDEMPWNKAEGNNEESWLKSKTPYVCHAELNAVLNKNLADIKGCVIYVALFPCNMCAQIIIQSGIKEVIYYSDKYHNDAKFHASRHLLNSAGVKYRQFRPHQKQILIDFDCIEETPSDAKVTELSSCNNATSSQIINSAETNHHSKSEDFIQSKQELSSNGIAGHEPGDSLNSDRISSTRKRDGMAVNNNNKGVPKEYKLEGRLGQEELQLHQDDEPALQLAPTPTPSEVRDEYMEYKFAAVSTFVIVFVAFFSWYLSHCKLTITNSV